MFIKFSYLKTNYRLANEKGQLTPFLIAILAVVIILAMMTINLGKIGLNKTHTSNASDAAALAAASVMAGIFDSLAAMSGSMYEEGYVAWAQLIGQTYEEADLHYNEAILLSEEAVGAADAAGDAGCTTDGWWDYLTKVWLGLYYIERALRTWEVFKGLVQQMRDLAVEAYEFQKEYYKMIRDGMEGVEENAKIAGYGYGMANIGISDPDYGKDENREPSSSYSWADNQKRSHNYNVNVSVAPINEYILYVTNGTKSQIENEYQDTFFWRWLALYIVWQIWGRIAWAIGYWVNLYGPLAWVGSLLIPGICDFWKKYVRAINLPLTTANNSIGASVIRIVNYLMYLFLESEGKTISSSSAGDTGDNILVTIKDVIHPRSLSTSASQSHQGADLGLWQTIYPTVSSSSSASFGGGSVDGHSPSPTHEPRLTGAH